RIRRLGPPPCASRSFGQADFQKRACPDSPASRRTGRRLKMKSIETMPVVAALGWTLIHFIWQGAIVALFLAIVKAALKNRTANLRYLASCVALLLMFALPLITFVTLSSGVAGAQLVTPGPAPGIASLTSK